VDPIRQAETNEVAEEAQPDPPGFGQFSGNPQPVYRGMRESLPGVSFIASSAGSLGLVSHRRDIDEVLRQPEVFSSTDAIDLQNVRPLIPLNVDPPHHRKYRKILDPLFAPRAVAYLEQPIARLANELMDAFAGREEIDFAASFSIPLPSQVFLTLMGLPLDELPTLLAMKDGIIRPQRVVGCPPGHPDAIAHQAQTAAAIYEYFGPVIDDRTREPRADLLTSFVQAEIDGDRLTREEMLDICFLFLLAGLDTVTASLDCMFAFLARNPEHRRRVAEDPSVIPAAVEELLRWETPVVAVTRLATRHAEVGGCPVPAGSRLAVMLGSANTDDTEFGDGDVVRFDRETNRHLAFGGGIHRCLGSHLARQELRVALREWHNRIPEYALKPDMELDYTTGIRSIEPFPLLLGFLGRAAGR
jgi:cytochrome P450